MAIEGGQPGLISQLSDSSVRAVSDLLAPGTPVALLNFANHPNPGDLAIWLGQLALLTRLEAEIVWLASRSSYDPDRLRRLLPPEGVVLLSGGGNLGDRYRPQQLVRERVLAEFRDRRVVQLPQSMWFVDGGRRDQFSDLCAAHPDLHLLWRDPVSARSACRHLQAATHRLVPDMAFSIGSLERPAPTSVETLWLLRRDAERRVDHHSLGPALPGDRVADWPDLLAAPEVEPPWLDANRSLTEEVESRGSLSDRADRELTATFEPFARHYVDQASTALRAAEVVVSDRLHGHVLALLAGTPSVVLDNADGKVHALADTWTSGHPSVRLVDDVAQAEAVARLLSRSRYAML